MCVPLVLWLVLGRFSDVLNAGPGSLVGPLRRRLPITRSVFGRSEAKCPADPYDLARPLQNEADDFMKTTGQELTPSVQSPSSPIIVRAEG